MRLFEFDEAYRRKYGRLVGIDEAGRGPIAGPVVASAVVLEIPIEGVDDSKKLSPKKREELFSRIMDLGRVGVGIATPSEIDELNILNATKLAMKRALEDLDYTADLVLIDGKNLELSKKTMCVVKGDSKSLSIAAASIVAKVVRDRIMTTCSRVFRGYGFEHNFGYPTRDHKTAVRVFGPTVFHRLTFSGVIENLDERILEEWRDSGKITTARYRAVLRKYQKLFKQQRLV